MRDLSEIKNLIEHDSAKNLKNNELEWLVKQAETVEKISKMPIVKGIGYLENLYNKTILIARESYEKNV